MVDLNNISLTEIVKLVKLKKISSLELTNHYIKNIEKGKKLNVHNKLVAKSLDRV